MFGYVTANWKELTKEQQLRYNSIYCGICRGIRDQSGHVARLGLSYDMAFLSALLMSLYEPEETSGKNACLLHPITKKPWVDNVYIRYAADMNVALSYYNFLDDWEDDRKVSAKILAGAFGSFLNITNACRIGLLPSELQSRIVAAGNIALSGARALAMDKKLLPLAQAIAENTEAVELAVLPEFAMTFAENMLFMEA